MAYQNEVGHWISEVEDYIKDNQRIIDMLNPYIVNAVRVGDWGLAESAKQAIERIQYLSNAYLIEKEKNKMTKNKTEVVKQCVTKD